MTNEEILAKLDIEKAIAEVVSVGRMFESETVALAKLKGKGGYGILQLEFTKDEDILSEFEGDNESEVNSEYQKSAYSPVDVEIINLKSLVGILSRDIGYKGQDERAIAQQYGPSLLAGIRRLLEVYSED